MRVLVSGFMLCLVAAALPASASDATSWFRQYCASCHGGDRLGGVGPALVPGNLKRLRPDAAHFAIHDGLPATQMPGFADQLSDPQINALVELIYQPLPHIPPWGRDEMQQTYVLHNNPARLRTRPAFSADPLNLFVVVESGDHHVSILDGDTFERIYRFKSRRALHGGPKFSPRGRFVYFASRDGWISKFDMYNLCLVAEIRAGINTRNLAVSADGRHLAIANYLPHSIVILDADLLIPIQIIPVADDEGHSSRVSAVYDAAPRQSFVAALKDLKEIWEISYADEPPYYGRVHDYRYEGPPKVTERFPVRRIRIDTYLDDFFFDQPYQHLIGAARDGKGAQVINMAIGRSIATLPLPGLPHLGSGISWNYNKTTVIATPNLKQGIVSIIDIDNWQVIHRIKTLGPGFFLRSHERSKYAWADVFFGPDRDAVHVIDKNTFTIVATLRPAPGKTSGHVEFTRDGRYALVSIWEQDGAVVVYDADTLTEVKRIPMSRPAGKYNVYNKITRSAGTSH